MSAIPVPASLAGRAATSPPRPGTPPPQDGLVPGFPLVLTAAGGAEALVTSAPYPARIHVMLTDVVMPEMTGKEVARHVRQSRPGLRVLYMSGYTDHAAVRRGTLEAGTHFVSKPFNASDLTAAVRAALDEPESEAGGPGTQSE